MGIEWDWRGIDPLVLEHSYRITSPFGSMIYLLFSWHFLTIFHGCVKFQAQHLGDNRVWIPEVVLKKNLLSGSLWQFNITMENHHLDQCPYQTVQWPVGSAKVSAKICQNTSPMWLMDASHPGQNCLRIRDQLGIENSSNLLHVVFPRIDEYELPMLLFTISMCKPVPCKKRSFHHHS